MLRLRTYKAFIVCFVVYSLAIVLLDRLSNSWDLSTFWTVTVATLIGQAIYLLTMPIKHRRIMLAIFIVLSVIAYIGLYITHILDATDWGF